MYRVPEKGTNRLASGKLDEVPVAEPLSIQGEENTYIMNTLFESDAPAGSEPGATETHVAASNEPIALPGAGPLEESVKGGESHLRKAADETPSGASGDEDFVPPKKHLANSTMLQAMVGERWKEAVWVDTHGKYVHTDGTYVQRGPIPTTRLQHSAQATRLLSPEARPVCAPGTSRTPHRRMRGRRGWVRRPVRRPRIRRRTRIPGSTQEGARNRCLPPGGSRARTPAAGRGESDMNGHCHRTGRYERVTA